MSVPLSLECALSRRVTTFLKILSLEESVYELRG